MRLRDSKRTADKRANAGTDKPTQIVEWQLKYLSDHAGELSPSDLEWAIRMEDAYKRKGWLTEREAEVLANVYEKY